MSIITPARLVGTFETSAELNPRDIDTLARQGVARPALGGPNPVRVGHVVLDALGFEFEHHDTTGQEGVRALLFLISDHQGICRDIVAWSPDQNRLATWLGRSWALGEEAIYAPRLSNDGALPVWRTPLGWLKAGRRGICLIRPQAAAYHLDCAAPLLAEDAAHGAELKQLLTIPAPRILVSTCSLKVA